jgi:hypothetical protein
LIKGTSARFPYAAPEVADGESPTPKSDQYSLAAITYEWLFGRAIDGPARRSIEVIAMPGVDRVALSKALTRALASEPRDRFGTCAEFCDALAAAAVPELPLLAFDAGDEADNIDPIGPFIPESPAPNVDDVKIVAEETNLTAAQPDLDAIDAGARIDPSPMTAWHPPAPSRSSQSARFGGTALILAAIVGAVFGFAAGYMARPRALQSGPTETFATAPGTENAVTSAEKPAPKETAVAPKSSTQAPKAPTQALQAPKAPQAPKVPLAPEKAGRLLVRSSPSGATVSVDGVEKGVTPLALRDLEFGARSITIARRGYLPESRRIVITAGRPSRSLDVKLSAASQPVAPKRADSVPARPGTSATIGKPAAATGALNIDSRPAGANVTINGKPSGKTPLTINDLPPGDYQILMTMPGYRNFATTVRVVAGERVRAAASLTAQEQE